jgi:hypothetical protein
VNPDVHIGDTLKGQADGIAKSPEHIHNGKQVIAGSTNTKSNVFGLNGGQCNLSLETEYPENGQSKASMMKPVQLWLQ